MRNLEKPVATGASLIVLRYEPRDFDFGGLYRRWIVCDRSTGHRSKLGDQFDNGTEVYGYLDGFVIKKRSVAWVSTDTTSISATSQRTVRTRRFGERTESFAVPSVPQHDGSSPGSTTVRGLRLNARGQVAFVATSLGPQVLYTLGADGIGRRVDFGTVRSVRWAGSSTLGWQNSGTPRRARVAHGRDPCAGKVGQVADATLTSVVGYVGGVSGSGPGAYVGCLRRRGTATRLGLTGVSFSSFGSIGLNGRFAASTQPTGEDRRVSVSVTDLATGRTVGPPTSASFLSQITVASNGRLTVTDRCAETPICRPSTSTP